MEKGEAKRRIAAARILRNITQDEMSRRGAELGLDAQELARTERGTLEFTEARKMVLCKVLDVPACWFDEPDVDKLVGVTQARERDALDLLERLVDDYGRARGIGLGGADSGEDAADRPDEAAGGAGA